MSSYEYGRDWRFQQMSFNLPDPSVEDIVDAYTCWRDEKEYVILHNKETDETFAALAPKRGNVPYARRKRAQMAPIIDAFENMVLEQDVPGGRKNVKLAHCLLVTFTYDHSKISPVDAYRNCTKDINRFKAYLTKLLNSDKNDPYRKCGYVSMTVKEGTASGYPAPHMIIIFSRPIPVFKYNGKWRVQSKMIYNKLHEAWERATGSSIVDIQAVVDAKIDSYNPETKQSFRRSAIRYVLKYVTKTSDYDANLPEKQQRIADNTNAMMKYTGCRDIVGKKFMQMIGLSPDDNIRLDDPLYELKLLQSRLRKVKKEYDKHKDDFGFILTPLYREYNQLVYDERKLRMQIIMDSPPTKWEFMCVERFPLWMEAERIRYLDAIKRENEILKMGRQHSLDLENPEYIAAMIDGEDVY